MTLAAWMAGPTGRLLRVAVGLGLIGLGLAVVDGTWGRVLAVAGLLPIAAGLFNFCAIAPLLRAPFWGREARRRGGA